MSRSLVVLLAFAIAPMRPAAQPSVLFAFHSNAWLNLHHLVRLSARGEPPAAGLAEDESKTWAAGVDLYKPYGQRDLLFDAGMVDIKTALRGAEGKTNLEGIAVDENLKATLERLMPIYQKHWWLEHDRTNRAWIAAVQPLLDRHGLAVSRAVARSYGVTWPTGSIPVDVSVAAGPNGAYTSVPTHVTISSTDPGYQGFAALEMLFHEASHGVSQLFQQVRQAAGGQNVSVPPQLWHGVLFYTAGELTTRELRAHGIVYTPYADERLYTKLCGAGCRDKIAEHWTPHLDGTRSSADALSSLVASFK